jgi:hypothetical protein
MSDQIKIGGEFDFFLDNGHLKLSAKDVVIDGLSIPKYTWGWMGLAVAQGVLSALGSAVFGALVDVIFGSGKSLEQLLKEQLAEFTRIVEEKLQENDLRNYEAILSAYVQLYQEYTNDPARAGSLDFLINNSAVVLNQIQTLGFKGYRTYMTAAGLRLTVLQERIKLSPEKAGPGRNFITQLERSTDFHNQILKEIDRTLSPEGQCEHFIQAAQAAGHAGYLFNLMVDALRKNPSTGPLMEPIYGVKYDDMPLKNIEDIIPGGIMGQKGKAVSKQIFPANRRIDFIDWAAFRAKIKADTTNIGEKMVQRWAGYQPAVA